MPRVYSNSDLNSPIAAVVEPVTGDSFLQVLPRIRLRADSNSANGGYQNPAFELYITQGSIQSRISRDWLRDITQRQWDEPPNALMIELVKEKYPRPENHNVKEYVWGFVPLTLGNITQPISRD